MSKKNDSATNNGTMTGATNAPEKKAKEPVKVYASKEEAMSAKPTTEGYTLFVVTVPEKPNRFVWSKWSSLAVNAVARADGYKASTSGKTPTKEKVSEMLAQLSEDDRKALLAQFGKKK